MAGQRGRGLVEDFKPGISFVVLSLPTLLTDAASRCIRNGGSPASPWRARDLPPDQWRYLTLENLERDVRTTVLPDDDDTPDEHPWEWLAGLLHLHGVEATADQLRGLPYILVFSERLRARLGVT